MGPSARPFGSRPALAARGKAASAALSIALTLAGFGAPGLASAPSPGGPAATDGGPRARQAEPAPAPRSRRRLRIQWIGLRVYLGSTGVTIMEPRGEYSVGYHQAVGLHAGGELVLFTLRWPRLYWEILRIGGGAHRYDPQVEPMDPFDTASVLDTPGIRGEIFWGTAIGYPIVLDARGRDELRVGVHLSMLSGFLVTYSGIQLLYQHQTDSGLHMQIGLMQTSYPFGAMLMLGLSL